MSRRECRSQCTYLGSFRWLGEHVEPLDAQEIEKVLETSAQFELTPFGYSVADEPWAYFIAPAAVHLKANTDRLEMHKSEVREWEENV